jgi:TonB family protein
MKCSRFKTAAWLLGWLGLLVPTALLAQSDESRHALSELESATSLNRVGVSPWHLQMSFDLYDLDGKKKESGTIEEWWIKPGRSKIVITSPSYTVTLPAAPGENVKNDREAYLVNLLLRQVVHPVQEYSRFQGLTFETEAQKFGKVMLSCISVHPQQLKGSPESFGWPEYCAEPNTTTLRMRFDGGEFGITRNQVGTFMNTSVALRNTINYAGKVAIDGNVTKLESYAPDKAEIVADDSASAGQQVPGIVVSGSRIKYVQPNYPVYEKLSHASGSVVLYAVISREGTISSLDVVASPAKDFSETALEAVRQWVYRPYLLNGEPREVNTTITVNFKMYGN